jgi:hypothetical protein
VANHRRLDAYFALPVKRGCSIGRKVPGSCKGRVSSVQTLQYHFNLVSAAPRSFFAAPSWWRKVSIFPTCPSSRPLGKEGREGGQDWRGWSDRTKIKKENTVTHLQRRLEAERRISRRSFTMKGVVTKRHFFSMARTFGLAKAIRVLFATQATALSILMA